MESLSFFVEGIPTPKGSTTRMPNGATLPAGTPASRERAKNWRTDVRTKAREVVGDRPPSPGPMRVLADFVLPYPHSSIRKYQFGWWPHTKTPDVDKLLRSIMDHLTGIVWYDDSQVISVVLNKSYAWDGISGATIVVEEVSEQELKEIALSTSYIRRLIDHA